MTLFPLCLLHTEYMAPILSAERGLYAILEHEKGGEQWVRLFRRSSQLLIFYS